MKKMLIVNTEILIVNTEIQKYRDSSVYGNNVAYTC